MKIISCYISGFGRIRDMKFDEFSDGLTQILADNGWGKTTFCAFLKAMFYGLEYKKSSNAKLYERTHYLPWDQGMFGGSLTFSVDDRTYRIERYFGKKESEDTFELFDDVTGFKSNEFDENIGESVFGVDRDSFEKSVFFGQSLLATSLTPSLNAKMGDISSAQDDMDQFDEAIKRIEDARKTYTSTSKINPGKLVLIKEEIRDCKEAEESIPILIDALKERKRSLDEKKRELRAIDIKRQELAQKNEKASEEKQKLAALKSRLEEINERMPDEKKQAFFEEIFRQEIPTDEKISEWQKQAAELEKLRLQGETESLSEEDKVQLDKLKGCFPNGVPSDEDIQEYRKKAEKLTEIDGRVQALKQQRSIISEQMPNIDKRDETDPRKGRRIFGILISVLMIAGALAVKIFVGGIILPIVLVMIGILGIAYAVVSQRQEKREKNLHLEANLERQSEIDEEINLCYEQKVYIEGECKSLLEQYSFISEEKILPAIVELQLNVDKYNRLIAIEESSMEKTSKNIEELTEKQMSLYTELLTFAKFYGYDLFEDHKEADLLSALEKDVIDYNQFIESKERIEDVNRQLDEQLLILKKYEINDDVDENIDDRYIELHKMIDKEEESINKQGNELEDTEEKQRHLASLIELESSMKEKVRLYENTVNYLTKAKEEFLSEFMRPLRMGMKKYLDRIHTSSENEIKGSDFVLDMDLSIRLRYQGSTKESGYLSAGYRDLTALCARLTLVDVLYKDKKPMLIMDDPFCNLDEDKIENGLELLHEIAKECQIIYFSCHESRINKSEKMILLNS